MSNYSLIRIVADLHYSSGLIGHREYVERIDVSRWLDGDNADDPRTVGRGAPDPDEGVADSTPSDPAHTEGHSGEQLQKALGRTDRPPPPMTFTPTGLRKRWVFTISDDDNYPSVPHGHENHQNQDWKKLDPYRGLVFRKIDIESTGDRLNRDEMRKLWGDPEFRDHVLRHIDAYADRFRAFPWRVANRRLLPRW